MITLTLDPAAATLGEAKRRLGLGDADVDAAFGVVELDPEAHVYAIRVEDAAAERMDRSAPGLSGPFDDLPIEPLD